MLEGFRRSLTLIALTGTAAATLGAQSPGDSASRRDSLARDAVAHDSLARTSALRDSLVRDSSARAAASIGGTTANAASGARDSATANGPSPKATTSRPSPAAGPLLLLADISSRRLHLYQGNDLVKSYDVAVGTAKYPTPRGTYRIRKIVWNPGWVPPDSKWARGKTPKGPGERGNPMKVVKIFFKEPTYYIHGTGDIESLGSAASHGCLRMHPNDAAEVAQYIMEHGGQPRDESWFRRVLRVRDQSRTIYLESSVPLTIRG